VSIPEVQPEEALRDLEAIPEIQVVDVRDAGAFRRYHLPGARSIPLGELAGRVAELDADRPVYTVCARGKRSLEGARILVDLGFEQVKSIAHGTEGWKERGLPWEG